MKTPDLKSILATEAQLSPELRGLSSMARSIIGSEILKIAGEIREMLAKGADVLNLTVGDFSSREFPVPELLSEGIAKAIRDGHTNYPPSSGMIELREAVRNFYAERLKLDYPLDSVVITCGSRPGIAGTYLTLIDPGDEVVYGLPSWNNNHYSVLVGAKKSEVVTASARGFFPSAKELEPHLSTARLVCMNSPQNPTGTAVDATELERIARQIVEENRRRKSRGQAALYLMYDQVYWWLTFRDTVHAHPVELVPEVAPYTLYVDGISKGFAATGLRVGWVLGPTDVIKRMNAILTHVGTWAPRPEQIATASLLGDGRAVDTYLTGMKRQVLARLEALSRGVSELRQAGFDAEVIPPQGAIYLSMRLGVLGKKAPGGRVLATDEDIRRFVLEEAQIALVPFQAFGLRENSGWFRASVGAVSTAACESIGPRLRAALSKLS